MERGFRLRLEARIRLAFSLSADSGRLLAAVRARTSILKPADPRDDRRPFVGALAAIAGQSAAWIRPPETFAAPPGSARVQLAALARHLFARFAVPEFLDSVWFADEGHGWFVHAAAGGSLRTAGFPLPLTRAAAHWLRSAPHHLSVGAALRWAQVRAAGGTVELAAAVASSGVAEVRTDHAFWEAAFHLLAGHPELELARVPGLIDHLRCERAARRDYSLKGRTLAELLSAVGAPARPRHAAVRIVSWPRSPFAEATLHDRLGRPWHFVELLTNVDLVDEARTMHHCVASFVRDCWHRRCAVFSVSIDTDEGPFRVATFEIDLRRRMIVQVRGRFNRPTRGMGLEMVRAWAESQGLIPRC